MEKEKKYSVEEKKAYYIGIGAGIGFGRTKNIQKMMKSMTAQEKKSFQNGLDDGMSKKYWKKGGAKNGN